MNGTVGIVVFYGLFSLIGGIIGYVKAKSKASLIAGAISGLVLLVSAYGMAQGNPRAAFVAGGAALLLGGLFLGTWLKNHRLMPDLLMVLFSLATLIGVGLKILIK